MKFFSYKKRRPVLFSAIIFFTLIVGSFGLHIKRTKAILPFGGPILLVTPCTCSLNLAITVGPPNSGVFTYEEGMVYPFYQLFREGPWTLGSYIPGSAGCWMVGDPCYPVLFPIGTIDEVGTSM